MPPRGGVFAVLHDGAGAIVAVGLEEADDVLRRRVLPDVQRHARAAECVPGRDALDQRVDGGQQDARASGRVE